MNNPLVSIIIPTYNRAHSIVDTLNSVLSQTYPNWECIVVDDGSTDHTEQVLSTYAQKEDRIKFFKRPLDKLKGANSCRNFGAQSSKGEYLIFLDSDDYLENFCIEKRVEKISGLDYFTFAVFPMNIKSATGEISEKKIPIRESYLEDFLSDKLHWQTMCPIWNKDFFLSIDGFNERYPRLNDPDLHIRAMITDSNNFYVFATNTPDTVYIPSNVTDFTQFSEKVHTSLVFFIPDITKILKQYEYNNKIFLLRGYLKMWLKSFMKYSAYKSNINIITVFYSNNIISFNKKNILIFNVFIYFLIIKISESYKRLIYKRLI